MTLNARRALFPLLLALVPATTLVQAQPPQKRQGRATMVIDGAWKFQTDPEKKGEALDWQHAAPSSAKTTAIPALWDKDAAPGYRGVAWYWREFDAPAGWRGQTVRLRFEAVAEKARVWLNGEKLGDHAGGVTPFEFTITPQLRFGDKNFLAVRVEGDAKTGAGLWQGVLLLAHDEAYLSDCFPRSDLFGELNAVIGIQNTSSNTGDATLDFRLVAANAPNKVLKKTNQNLHITQGRNLTTLITSLRGKSLTLWSPETPFLYRLQLAFRQDKDVLDTLETTFGFREFGCRNNAVTLNGRPLTLLSVALRLDQPLVIATAEDEVRAREILRRLRDKGANVIYLAAPPPALIRIADEEGLFLVISARSGQSPAAASEELRALVLRDRAHPSILAWNLGPADSAAAQSLRRLDPTRFLLVGPPSALQLWLPSQNEPSSMPLPPGLLPQNP